MLQWEDVGPEESEDGCDNQRVAVLGRSWPEAEEMRMRCVAGEEHQMQLNLLRGRSHCHTAAVVATAEAEGSCHNAAERSPWRGIDDWVGASTTATVEVAVAVVYRGSWLSKTVFGGGFATAWPLPARVRRV